MAGLVPAIFLDQAVRGPAMARNVDIFKSLVSDIGSVIRPRLDVTHEGEPDHVQNLALSLVRRRSRTSREILCFAVAGFADQPGSAKSCRQSGREGRHGAGGSVHPRRSGIHGPQWRDAFRIYAGDFV